METARTELPLDDRLISKKEACAILGIGVTKLDAMARQGHVHPIKFGERMNRYNINEIRSLARTGTP